MTRLPLTLRRARPADIRALASIEQASFTDPWSEHALGDSLASPLINVTVAETAEFGEPRIVGYSILAWAGDESELLNLAVREDARRRGVASALLERAVSDARGWGAGAVFLEVRDSNLAGRELYASAGFQQIGRRPGYYKRPSEDALILRRGIAVSG
jgi:[ribosomal protein S18]-alanine N-acetyltransferase